MQRKPKYVCKPNEVGKRVNQLIKTMQDKNRAQQPIHTIDKIAKILVDGSSYFDAYYNKNGSVKDY